MIFGFAKVVQLFFSALELLVLARVLFSWINPDPYNPIVRFVRQVTDPILEPLHKIIPPMGMLDLTPMVALIVLFVAEQIVMALVFAL